MKGKINNVIRIPTSLDAEFFKYWFDFLSPFHDLTTREIQVAAVILKERYELSKVITDDRILDRFLMGEETRKKIMNECNISLSYLQVILGKLKKANIIIDGKINPRFIPNVQEDSDFSLLLRFEFK